VLWRKTVGKRTKRQEKVKQFSIGWSRKALLGDLKRELKK
jgi:hypothetical protein